MQYSTLAATLVLSSVVLGADNPYATFPSVPHSASINGFADPIFDQLPSCAQSCVKQSTSNTPCPYWDTGCLCVMPQFDGPIAECIAKQCQGKDVSVATSLANSACSAAGVWEPYWMIPASLSAVLDKAAEAKATSVAPKTTADATTSEEGPKPTSSAEATTSEEAPKPTSSAEATTSEEAPKPTSTTEETKSEETTAAETSASETSISSVASISQVNAGNAMLPAWAAGAAGLVGGLAVVF